MVLALDQLAEVSPLAPMVLPKAQAGLSGPMVPAGVAVGWSSAASTRKSVPLPRQGDPRGAGAMCFIMISSKELMGRVWPMGR
ncbi:MAG: hypothetical protein IPJ68_00640 [Candidatus Moraniibacteriota bacterium]|nr:MAG: hypothetical protein IPJ68_00640 [Candidatus Moranbacteria bacterium]